MNHLLSSKRFWTAVGAVIAIIVANWSSIGEADVNRIVAIIVTWIAADTVRPTNPNKNPIFGNNS